MDRFILHETISRFQQMLASDLTEHERKYAAAELSAMQRQLALLDVAYLGAQKHPHQLGPPSRADRKLFQLLIETSADALLVIDPRPGLHIVDMTPAFEAATLANRDRALGDGLFQVFPDNPARPDADGVSSVLNAFREAADSGASQTTEVQRYDVRNADGAFVERYWRPVYIPVANEAGSLVWLVVRLQDVTSRYQR